jgi:hypothetical protein
MGYKRFIFGLADIVKPLTELMQEKQPYQCTSEAVAIFQTLKKPLYCPCSVLLTARRKVYQHSQE